MTTRLTRWGHSCVRVDRGNDHLVIDPGGYSDVAGALDGVTAALVTHEHVDHLDADRLPRVLAASPGARVVAEPSVAATLRQSGTDAARLAVGETVTLDAFTVEGVGGWHAVIHEDIPRVGNVGLLVRGPSGRTLFHPGDMLEATPDGVDVLALPIAAPWAALKEMVTFVRAVRPAQTFPIHDAVLSGIGRQVYLRVLGGLLPDGTELLDLSAAPVQF